MREAEFRSKVNALLRQYGVEFRGPRQPIICPFHTGPGGGPETEASLSYFQGARSGKWWLKCLAPQCRLFHRPLSEDDLARGEYKEPVIHGRDPEAERINRVAVDCAREIPYTAGGRQYIKDWRLPKDRVVWDNGTLTQKMLKAGVTVDELITYGYLTKEGRTPSMHRVGYVYYWQFPGEAAPVVLMIKWRQLLWLPFVDGGEGRRGPKFIVTGMPEGLGMPIYLPTPVTLAQDTLVCFGGEKDSLTALIYGDVPGAIGLPTEGYDAANIAGLIRPHQTVYVWLDRDSGGQHGSKQIAQDLADLLQRSVYRVTWPPDDSWEGTDISDYYAQMRPTPREFREWVKEMLGGATKVEPGWRKASRDRVEKLLCDNSIPLPRRKRLVAGAVIGELAQYGRFLLDAAECPYYYDAQSKTLHDLLDPDAVRRVLRAVGMNKHDPEAPHVQEELISTCEEDGERVTLEMGGARRGDSIYIDAHDGTMIRITPEAIERVDNGTDGVLFVAQRRAKPIPDGTPDKNAFWEIFELLHLEYPDQRYLIAAWAVLLGEGKRHMIAAPIPCFLGEHRWGKTSGLRAIGLLWNGDGWDVAGASGKEDDYWTAVKNNALIVVDNADRYIPWLADAIAITATGGIIMRRQLYTNSQIHDIEILCHLGITARTPKFHRADVADRLLLLNLKPIPRKMSDADFRQYILDRRVGALWYIFACLQHLLRGDSKPSQAALDDVDKHWRMMGWAEDAMSLGWLSEEDWCRIFRRHGKLQADFALDKYVWWDPLYNTYSDKGPTDWMYAREVLDEVNASLGEEGPLLDPKTGKDLTPQRFGRQLFSGAMREALTRLLGMEVQTDKRHKVHRVRFGYFGGDDAGDGDSPDTPSDAQPEELVMDVFGPGVSVVQEIRPDAPHTAHGDGGDNYPTAGAVPGETGHNKPPALPSEAQDMGVKTDSKIDWGVL